MKKLFLLSTILVFACLAYAQHIVKDANAEKRNISGFHAVKVSHGIDLFISQGEESLAVSASDTKYRNKIRTEVKEGVLRIWYESGIGVHIDQGNKKMKAYLSFKNLDRLEASGGSDISVDGIIAVPKLSLDMSGGSDFGGKVNVNDLKIDASGGADVDISGTAKDVTIDASGGSDFKGYELITDNCTVDASGGSDVYITVNKELNAESSGGSDVHYKGNGLIKNLKTSNSNIKKVIK
jgi:hypothetical protein